MPVWRWAAVAAALLVMLAPPTMAGPGGPGGPPTRPVTPAEPLNIEVATFAAGVGSDGRYLPRPDAVFQPTEQALIHVAVSGHGARPISTGVRLEFQVGVQIRAVGGGRVIARSNEIDNLVLDATAPPPKYLGVVRFGLPSLRPGAYTLHLTLRDAYTGRTGMRELPFSILPQV